MQHDFILLDRSSSMNSQWKEALDAVNLYVERLAAGKIDTGVTLATFDGLNGGCQFDVIRDRITPPTWRKVSNEDATPRGMTPLSDAIGRLVSLARGGNYDRVAIIIMTDGEENASHEYSVPQAKALLDECRGKGWQVIFLGSDFKNDRQATSYGTMTGQTISSATRNLGQTMSFMAETRGAYAATGQAMNFTEAQKAQVAPDSVGVSPIAPAPAGPKSRSKSKETLATSLGDGGTVVNPAK